MRNRICPLIAAIVLTLTSGASCSGGESTSQTDQTGTPATGPTRWIAFCVASYDSGVGNAATSDRTSWVQDCASECAMPEWEQSCLDQAKELGINVGG